MSLADFTPEEIDSGLAAVCLTLPAEIRALDLLALGLIS